MQFHPEVFHTDFGLKIIHNFVFSITKINYKFKIKNFIENKVSELKNQIKDKDADKIFRDIEKFAGYGFNKSHAAAYAMISYQTAWCKTNYPAEFIASLLNREIGNASEKISYLKSELDRLNINFYESDINQSQALFSIEYQGKEIAVRSGLANIKNIGPELANQIVKERENSGKFTSVINFVSRLGEFINNKRQLEFLAMAGVFDKFQNNRAIIHDSASNLLMISQTINRDINSNHNSIPFVLLTLASDHPISRSIAFSPSLLWLPCSAQTYFDGYVFSKSILFSGSNSSANIENEWWVRARITDANNRPVELF